MLEIQLPKSDRSFAPNEEIEIALRWDLPNPSRNIELRLVWNTVGKGDQDLSVVQTWHYPDPSQTESRKEKVALPAAPYSFSGKLISLIWALELIDLTGNDSARQEFVLAPATREILLQGGSGVEENSW